MLSEFRATASSQWLASELAAQGLPYQRTTADRREATRNGLLVASQWPLRRVGVRRAPSLSHRWLLARVAAPEPFTVGAMHVPNYVSGLKGDFYAGVLGVAQHWRGGPAMLIGDTNTGLPGIDEETSVFGPRNERWMHGLDAAGWTDAFRWLHGQRREYTWYSPNGGNGFRLDEAFLHRSLLPRLRGTRHEWGRADGSGGDARRDVLSDHAALIVDLASDDGQAGTY